MLKQFFGLPEDQITVIHNGVDFELLESSRDSEIFDEKFSKLRIKDGSTAGRFIEFSAIPTSFSMTSAVGEVIAADISFEANGAPTGLVL